MSLVEVLRVSWPSNSTSLVFDLPPPATGPVPEFPAGSTPGASVSSAYGLRPLSGSCTICCVVTTLPRDDVCASRSTAAADIEISCFTAPVSSVMLIVAV